MTIAVTAASGKLGCGISERQTERIGVQGSAVKTKDDGVAVFFYGLFMDVSLLSSKGISPSRAIVGYVDGFGLRIGKRATLVPDEADRAYGVLMTIRAGDVAALYSVGRVIGPTVVVAVLASAVQGKGRGALRQPEKGVR